MVDVALVAAPFDFAAVRRVVSADRPLQIVGRCNEAAVAAAAVMRVLQMVVGGGEPAQNTMRETQGKQ